ncbi:MAG: hypothetical protein JXR37_17050 [Kiritimatiellae bacterium]|nr:hypothetical protein [Kiritimatiellia bacterium]
MALPALLVFCLAVLPCLAGKKLSVRLVEATNRPGVKPAGLKDVIDVLKANLPYSSYRLADSTVLGLPADGSETVLDGYAVRCAGDQNALAIVVRQGRRELLKTSVVLQDNKPLIVGGFSIEGGKMILVFLVKRK